MILSIAPAGTSDTSSWRNTRHNQSERQRSGTDTERTGVNASVTENIKN